MTRTYERQTSKAFGKTAETPKRGRPTDSERDARIKREAAETSVMDIFHAGMVETVRTEIVKAKEEAVFSTLQELEEMEARIIKATSIKVKVLDKTREIEGTTHKMFADLLNIVATGDPTMVVGPAGSGKTYAAEQVAKALGLDFYAISVGSQTSKTDLLGYMTANGIYMQSMFRQAYEHGGIFLMDEIDAGNPNVLIVLNSALSSSQCAFPDKMVPRHEDFYFISTANTYGTGASRVYVGRNQIDAATLDRFTTMDWLVDEELEGALVSHLSKGQKWHKVVKEVRAYVTAQNYRVIVSPRATIKGAKLLEQGFPFNRVLEMTILPTADKDSRTNIIDKATAAWK